MDTIDPAAASASYHYFVSYAHDRGFGNCDIYAPEPIRDAADAANIGQLIRRGNELRDIVVLNFILLRGPQPSSDETEI